MQAIVDDARARPRYAVAAGLLLLLGCANAFGKLTRTDDFQRWAASTAASPAPNPFVARTKGPPSAQKRRGSLRVEVTLANGSTMSSEIGQQTRVRLVRPHRVELGLVVATLLRGNMPTASLQSLLRFGFCQGGPLAEVSGFPSDVVDVTYLDRRGDARRTVRAACGKAPP